MSRFFTLLPLYRVQEKKLEKDALSFTADFSRHVIICNSISDAKSTVSLGVFISDLVSTKNTETPFETRQ